MRIKGCFAQRLYSYLRRKYRIVTLGNVILSRGTYPICEKTLENVRQ